MLSDDEEVQPGACYWFCLPRNLSYTQESYLDSYSASSSYVHSPRHERLIEFQRGHYSQMADFSEYLLESSPDEPAGSEKSMLNIEAAAARQSNTEHAEGDVRSPASDLTSEEGVFVNMMDDLDDDDESLETPNGRSFCSENDIDSINSPDEDDLEKTYEGRRASLEEAVSEAVKSGIVQEPEGDSRQTKSPNPELKLEIQCASAGAGSAESGSQKSIYDLISGDSPVYEESEFQFTKGELRKSSSLKTTKTPPGTPRRKKMVRFADVMGLDLESVRNIVNLDVPPIIPASAMADLKIGVEEDRKSVGSRYFTLCFPQPGALDGFMSRIIAQKVCLENAIVTDTTITGVVRVASIGYHKCVRVRYTINNWVTFYDVMASYVQDSFDGQSDRFSFSIVAPAELGVGCKLMFAISYTVNDTTYWDNNNNEDYGFECFAKTTPTDIESSWVHFL